MITIPPYLKKGDRVGLVCPSGFMPYEKTTECIQALQEWGYEVVVGNTVGHQFHYFSGTDAERLADLQNMLDDPGIKAVLCARGGYGMSRIIDQLDMHAFQKNPKWLIGFSDITVLQAHLYQTQLTASLHAPMAGAFQEKGAENEYVVSLKKALSGERANYVCPAHPLNRMGTAEGELIGGNLSLVAHLIGSASSYQTKGKILFLEDVGEYLYNIDRMLIQLKRAGMLSSLSGLILGGFTEMKDTVTPFGQDVFTILHSHLTDYDYPVSFDFPVSHATPNYALKIGVVHRLEVGETQVRLREIG
ncbi:MAG: LD-carboxypeptidase [Bacteroidota bacterium]|nr:LD-carboxypeptidase [Bacteroidota bacterium]